ncbi:Cyclin/Cyclin-like subunit Ssn8 like protein [Aduncisulcus paluster]|uniref:Cyclin/Cyclin-like subunit Ssn8 like protein n=1 Tax=Aduncisulcus paluster TaxID=2918883 RepID=A0ABQ5KK78_9EUKA|nr:Cyclin/Cyclin-like subunit Ssn8 like protein [Aduncisulcus paluster]
MQEYEDTQKQLQSPQQTSGTEKSEYQSEIADHPKIYPSTGITPLISQLSLQTPETAAFSPEASKAKRKVVTINAGLVQPSFFPSVHDVSLSKGVHDATKDMLECLKQQGKTPQIMDGLWLKQDHFLLSDPILRKECISCMEEESILIHYLWKVEALCQRFDMCIRTEYTAVTLLRRFYVEKSVFDFNPRIMALTAVFLAGKIEDEVKDAADISRVTGVPSYQFIAYESQLMEGIGFNLSIHKPFPTFKNIDLKFRNLFIDGGGKYEISLPSAVRGNSSEFASPIFLVNNTNISNTTTPIIYSALCNAKVAADYLSRHQFIPSRCHERAHKSEKSDQRHIDYALNPLSAVPSRISIQELITSESGKEGSPFSDPHAVPSHPVDCILFIKDCIMRYIMRSDVILTSGPSAQALFCIGEALFFAANFSHERMESEAAYVASQRRQMHVRIKDIDSLTPYEHQEADSSIVIDVTEDDQVSAHISCDKANIKEEEEEHAGLLSRPALSKSSSTRSVHFASSSILSGSDSDLASSPNKLCLSIPQTSGDAPSSSSSLPPSPTVSARYRGGDISGNESNVSSLVSGESSCISPSSSSSLSSPRTASSSTPALQFTRKECWTSGVKIVGHVIRPSMIKAFSTALSAITGFTKRVFEDPSVTHDDPSALFDPSVYPSEYTLTLHPATLFFCTPPQDRILKKLKERLHGCRNDLSQPDTVLYAASQQVLNDELGEKQREDDAKLKAQEVEDERKLLHGENRNIIEDMEVHEIHENEDEDSSKPKKRRTFGDEIADSTHSKKKSTFRW